MHFDIVVAVIEEFAVEIEVVDSPYFVAFEEILKLGPYSAAFVLECLDSLDLESRHLDSAFRTQCELTPIFIIIVLFYRGRFSIDCL